MDKLISVKIPTYNCANYLVKTIESVLNQKDFNLELLDIEVIDDCSTKDNPKEIVDDFGQGRVSFYRQPKNVGAVNNFNTCIDRCNTKYLHVLHGDDFIEELFYAEIIRLINLNANANLLTTRSFFVNKYNEVFAYSDEIQNTSKVQFISNTPIQFAGTIIETNTIKLLNGFDTNLIHLNDRDMWLRILLFNERNWVHSNKILSNYRIFEENDTSKLVQTGENINDLYRYYIKNKNMLGLNQFTIKKLIFEFYINQNKKLQTYKAKIINLIVVIKLIGLIDYAKRMVKNILYKY